MFVNVTDTATRAGIERRIHAAHSFPVVGEFIERPEVETGFPRRIVQRRHHAIEIGLTSGAGQRGNGQVGNIHAGLGGFQHRSGVYTAGIVCVKMDRQTHFLP